MAKLDQDKKGKGTLRNIFKVDVFKPHASDYHPLHMVPIFYMGCLLVFYSQEASLAQVWVELQHKNFFQIILSPSPLGGRLEIFAHSGYMDRVDLMGSVYGTAIVSAFLSSYALFFWIVRKEQLYSKVLSAERLNYWLEWASTRMMPMLCLGIFQYVIQYPIPQNPVGLIRLFHGVLGNIWAFTEFTIMYVVLYNVIFGLMLVVYLYYLKYGPLREKLR